MQQIGYKDFYPRVCITLSLSTLIKDCIQLLVALRRGGDALVYFVFVACL